MSSERIWGTIDDGKIKFINYESSYQQGVINVIRKSFFQFEAVSVGSEINICEEAQNDLSLLCLDVLENSNSSIIAIDSSTNEVVGAALNVIQLKPPTSGGQCYFEIFRDTVCKSDSAKSLMSYMIAMDAKFDFFEHYQVDSLLEIMFLATLPEYMQKGIAYKLCLYSIELAKEFKNGVNLDMLPANIRNFPPKLVTSMFTSSKPIKLGEKLGFKTLVVEPHKNFSFKGKTFAERNGDPDCVSALVAMEI